MQKFKSVEKLINQLKPEKPVYCIRKNSVTIASKFFQKNFPGDILYAVKTNPHPLIIKTLLESGINQFDVASIEEIKAVRKFDNTAKCSFMHTVKSRESIKEAYFNSKVKISFFNAFWTFNCMHKRTFCCACKFSYSLNLFNRRNIKLIYSTFK